MSMKIETLEKISNAIKRRFYHNLFQFGFKEYIEDSFAQNTLKDSSIFNPDYIDVNPYLACDPPDDRFEAMESLYSEFINSGAIPIRAFIGTNDNLVEVIGNFLSVEIDDDYHFRTVSHTIDQHLWYAIGGMCKINWAVYISEPDVLTRQYQFRDTIMEFARKHDFDVDEFYPDCQMLHLFYKGSQMYKYAIEGKLKKNEIFKGKRNTPLAEVRKGRGKEKIDEG